MAFLTPIVGSSVTLPIEESQVTDLVSDLEARLLLSGGTLTGNLAMGGYNITGAGNISASSFTGTITGNISESQVTGLSASLSALLPLSGGTLTGALHMTPNQKLWFSSTDWMEGTGNGNLNLLATGVFGIQPTTESFNLNGVPLYMNSGGGGNGNPGGGNPNGAVLSLDSATLAFDSVATVNTDGSGNLTLNCAAISVQQNNNAITFEDYTGFPLWILNTNDNIGGQPVFSLTNNDEGSYVFTITDNSGDNTTFEFFGNTRVVMDNTLLVQGTTALDAGDITTNGSGQLTAASFVTANNCYIGTEHAYNQYNGIWFGIAPSATGISNYTFLAAPNGANYDTFLNSTNNLHLRIDNTTYLEVANNGTVHISTAFSNDASNIAVNGAGTGASGNASFVQTDVGIAYKKVVIRLNSLKSPTSIAWTFPTAFIYAPYLYGPMASYATASTTSVAITTSTAQTGLLFIEGY